MKVLLINGSPHPDGCTARALKAVADALEKEQIETETVLIGTKPLADCIDCGQCRKLGKCVFDDVVNEITEKAKTSDGFVFGCPVYTLPHDCQSAATIVYKRKICDGSI